MTHRRPAGAVDASTRAQRAASYASAAARISTRASAASPQPGSFDACPAGRKILVDPEEGLDAVALDLRQVGAGRIHVVGRHADDRFVRGAAIAHAQRAERTQPDQHAGYSGAR